MTTFFFVAVVVSLSFFVAVIVNASPFQNLYVHNTVASASSFSFRAGTRAACGFDLSILESGHTCSGVA